MKYQIDAAANELLIMGEIGPDFWGESSIDARDIVDSLVDMDGPLTVRINSFGGSVADGLAIYSALARYPNQVITRIEGYAYSIASLIAMAGNRIEMPENALLMIHGPSTIQEGNAGDFRDAADILERHIEAMVSAYVRGGAVSENAVREWLSDGADHYFTANDAAMVGLVDSIVPALPIAAVLPIAELRQLKGVTNVERLINQPQPDEILAQERQRISAIRDQMGLQAIRLIDADQRLQLEKDAIEQGWTIDRLNSEILARLPASEPLSQPMGSRQSIDVGVDALDKLQAGLTEALSYRAGLDRADDAEQRMGQSEFSGMSMVEMARRTLEARHISVKGLNRDRIMARALSVRADAGITHTTGDFPAILENTLNKAILMGWNETEETWRGIAKVGNLPDFREASRTDIGEYPTLPEVPEGQEFKYVTLSDRKETIILLTYGSIVGVTRQALVNDDLNLFQRVGTKQGRASARRVGDLVFLVLTSNPTMVQDGKSLFHADHNNIATAAAPSVASLDEHRRLMALQKDPDNHVHGLDLPLQRVIVPKSLQTVAEVLRDAVDNPDNVGGRDPNPFRQTFSVVADPRLDSDSLTRWYTSTNPDTFDVIEAGFLEGQQTPYLESRQGWTIDGLEAKVRIDCGASPLDFRTLVKNDGA